MRIRIGYVAIALNLPKVTSSSTVTYTNYQKLSSSEQKLNKLKQVTLSNIDDLYKILQYNVENNIHFYRITSALVPLATHPDVADWDYRKIFSIDFKHVGKFIKDNNMRVDTHPDEFNVINSIREEVVISAKRNLWSHVHLFDDMQYPNGRMVLHIGGAQGGKEVAMQRFIDNFKNFPCEITDRLMLENDDKTFTATEVLYICRETGAPIVFDVHHHMCNNTGETVESLISDIFKTWESQPLPAKFHFSTPRDTEKDRKHADYINAEDFVSFIEICRPLDKDFDIMLEAKMKDKALFQLVKDIKVLRPDWNWIDNTTLEF
ncbi:UV damage endonuclease UvdE [Clostridiales bacterium oral taxon 876 str. F0540]|nr:UV damage endonuclease UvdE [Clostridiales bacterium oral taxon 876 str. F0540]